MTRYKILDAWAKQKVDEDSRIEVSYSDLSIHLQQQAEKNIQVYNQLFNDNETVYSWTWFFDQYQDTVLRAYKI